MPNVDLKKKLWCNLISYWKAEGYALEYKEQILGLIFYKYLSEKLELYLNEELIYDGISFQEAYQDEEYVPLLEEEAIDTLGYFIQPKYLFRNTVNRIKEGKEILEHLYKAFDEINFSSLCTDSEDNFINIMRDVDFYLIRYTYANEINKLVSDLMLILDDIDFAFNDENNIGDAFEYMLSQFELMNGKKAIESYTPQQISTLMAKLVTLNKSKLGSVYDPACGTGSLLLRVSKEKEVENFYGQELNQTTYNLARMNMILHGINYYQFDIKEGDSLENPKHLGMKFDAIVTHLPLRVTWSRENKLSDVRFSESGILPLNHRAEYAFILHMLYHLKKQGTIVLLSYTGHLLNKTGSKTEIIKYLTVKKNYLDAVIKLPENSLYGGNIAPCLLVFKKCREYGGILFIDASDVYEKLKFMNKLRPEDINKIVTTYASHKEIKYFSREVSLEEINENNYSLFPRRYIDKYNS